MARGANGDMDSFRILVERWERPVFIFLDRMLDSPEEAQDLGQETFLKMCREAERYQPSGRFKSWLFRIAGNLARSRLRRRKILKWIRFEPEKHDHGASARPADRDLEAREIRVMVREALRRLPERQRQAVILRQFENLDYKEIAEAMGTTVSAVETLLHRAMRALREDLSRKKMEES